MTLIRGFNLPRSFLPLGMLRGNPFGQNFGRYEVMRKGKRYKYSYVCTLPKMDYESREQWASAVLLVAKNLLDYHLEKGTYRGDYFQIEIDMTAEDENKQEITWSKKSEFYLFPEQALAVMEEKILYAEDEYLIFDIVVVNQTDIKFNAIFR